MIEIVGEYNLKKHFTTIALILLLASGCAKDKASTEIEDHNINRIKEYISENVSISEDKEIEYEEWIDEEGICYRVAVWYKEEQEDKYRHSEDYFLFVTDDGVKSVYVDYTKENTEADRYVWNACDFDACLQDVTFDGHKDLIISLGHAGAGGDMIYCAYVYKDGDYIYTKSFERIPNYRLDEERQRIVSLVSEEVVYVFDENTFEFKIE